MCGRYSLSTPGERLAEVFGVEESVTLEPRFNIAPTQAAPVVRQVADDQAELSLLRWGLVPHWADSETIGNRMINARAETAAEKPAYRESFAARRCLVPADGFYEWQAVGRRKQPYFFSRPDGEPFAIAGLWSRWNRGAEPLESFALLTTDANAVVGAVHDRMPVILEPEAWSQWLGGGSGDTGRLASLLVPAADESLLGYPVSTFVNSPTNDSSRCVEAIDASELPVEEDPMPPTSQRRLF